MAHPQLMGKNYRVGQSKLGLGSTSRVESLQTTVKRPLWTANPPAFKPLS